MGWAAHRGRPEDIRQRGLRTLHWQHLAQQYAADLPDRERPLGAVSAGPVRSSVLGKVRQRPEVYEELGIPCWKFEVDGRVGLPAAAYSDADSWRRMLEDAIIMGSNPDKWYVCGGYLNVFNSWKWENGQWTTPTN